MAFIRTVLKKLASMLLKLAADAPPSTTGPVANPSRPFGELRTANSPTVMAGSVQLLGMAEIKQQLAAHWSAVADIVCCIQITVIDVSGRNVLLDSSLDEVKDDLSVVIPACAKGYFDLCKTQELCAAGDQLCRRCRKEGLRSLLNTPFAHAVFISCGFCGPMRARAGAGPAAV